MLICVDQNGLLAAGYPLRGHRKAILIGPAHLPFFGHVLCGNAHMAVGEGAPESVADNHDHQLPMADAIAATPAVHQVRRARHVLHATRHHALGIAEADRLSG
jgi:hypothetical protein